MGAQRNDWDFALRIQGVKPRQMSLASVADYLRAFASLVGDPDTVKFGGVVSGSAVLRARVADDRRPRARLRILAAGAENSDAVGADRAKAVIEALLLRERLTGSVVDRDGAVLIQFPLAKRHAVREIIVQDSGTIDGVVVGIEGIDDTIHVRVRDANGSTASLVTRSVTLARDLAHHFRSDPIRAYVHGTWCRSEGTWQPKNLQLDRFEILHTEAATELFARLTAMGGSKWATMDDPDAFLAELRGDD